MDLVSPGTRLYGFCNGYFGRDSFDNKLVIASGVWNRTSWCVAENTNGTLLFASDFSNAELDTWKDPASEM